MSALLGSDVDPASGQKVRWVFATAVPDGAPVQGSGPRVLAAGRRFAGRYTLRESLGASSTSEVWGAYDEELGREVAIKIHRRGRDPSLQQRFRREVELLSALEHPNVVALVGAGEAEGSLYHCCERIYGCDLDQAMNGRTRTDRLELFLQLTEALAHAHKRGVVHRDLKPSNVLVDIAGRVHVVDFGLGALTRGQAGLTKAGALVGTPAFMAPEGFAAQGLPAQPSQDVWALGVILYKALVDRPPFRAQGLLALRALICGEQPTRPRQLDPSVPPAVEELCLRCLEKEPARRLRDASILGAALREAGVRSAPSRQTRPRDARAAFQVKASSSPDRTTWIGPYRVLGVLGRGGGGTVYRAEQPGLKREVAVKVLSERGPVSSQERERFKVEALATARLSHPNIVKVHDAGQDEGLPYLVLDLVEGESLQERLEREGALEILEAVRLAHDLAGALDYLHEQLVLHRDVKPANVLLAPDGAPLLTDLGLAKLQGIPAGAELTRTGEILGTPAYMAPEQLDDARLVDVRADVYGLGATLYALLAGQAPFLGDSMVAVLVAVMHEEPPSLTRARPEVDPQLMTICGHCLAKAPEDRYVSARALQDDLARYLRGEPVGARPPGRLERWRLWLRRHPSLVRAALIVAPLLVCGGLALASWIVSARARMAVRVKTAELERQLKLAHVARLASSRGEIALQDRARRAAQAASEALDASRVGAHSRASLSDAFRALVKVEAWQQMTPRDPAAVAARLRAATALGEIALEEEEWGLSRRAFERALGMSDDDEAIRERIAKVIRREQEAPRQRAEALKVLLLRIESGELRSSPNRLMEAKLDLVSHSDPEAVRQIVAHLDLVTQRILAKVTSILKSVVEPDAAERARGEKPLRGLEDSLRKRAANPTRALLPSEAHLIKVAQERLGARAARASSSPSRLGWGAARRRLLAWRVRDSLAPGDLDLANAACEVLGWIGIRQGAVDALGRYLAVEVNPDLALAAVRALCRLGGESALGLVRLARRRHRRDPWFLANTDQLLRRARERSDAPR